MRRQPDQDPVARHFNLMRDEGLAPERFPLGEHPLGKIAQLIEGRSAAFQYLLTGAVLAAIFVVDVVTGPELASSVFYLVPIVIIAWHRDWPGARLIALLSGVAWLGADILAEHRYSAGAIQFWNGAVRTGVFLVFGYMTSQLRRAVLEEQRLARTDSLTGAANSRSFLEAAAHEIARQRRYEHPLTIGFCDCDDFKQVNDRFGHAAGDALLRAIVVAMQKTLRETDVVARLGGDEFAVLLPETDEAAAQYVLKKLRAALTGVGAAYGVTFSIGMVTYRTPADSVDQLVRTADQVMYEAKRAGKDRSRHQVIAAPSESAALED